MNDVTFGAGTLFVGTPDGELHPLGECEEMELCEAVMDKDIPRINEILSINEDASFSITLNQEQVDAFFELFRRIRALAIDMVRAAGYHRIAHLASHSKSWRVRKKNLFRTYRILKREGVL